MSKQDPQGIGALVRQSWTAIERYVPSRDEIAVVLCSVQDAGNVGTYCEPPMQSVARPFLWWETADPYGPVAVKETGLRLHQSVGECDIRNLRR